MNAYSRLLVISLLIKMLAGCSRPAGEFEIGGQTMGTSWKAHLVLKDQDQAESIERALQARLDQLEAIFSNWRSGSEIEQFNSSKETEWRSVSVELAEVVTAAQKISEQTNGAFDITLAPLSKLWGFVDGEARKNLPSIDAIQEVRNRTGWQKLECRLSPPALRKIHPLITINVSALVEGYAVDHLVEILKGQGIDHFLLDVGGEMFGSGHHLDGSPWTVGIQVPGNDKNYVATAVPLENQALSTSGTYRQFVEIEGKHYPHIFDGRTGWPIDHAIESVSVIHSRCLEADGWSTALLILGEEGREMASRKGLSAVFIESRNNTNP